MRMIKAKKVKLRVNNETFIQLDFNLDNNINVELQ